MIRSHVSRVIVSQTRNLPNSERALRYIQARKFVPCWNDAKPLSALRYASCTRSSASSRLCVSQCAKLYNEANIGIASASKDSASVLRFATTQYGTPSVLGARLEVQLTGAHRDPRIRESRLRPQVHE